MSLIEQLGGYEEAKKWLDENNADVEWGCLGDYRRELLEYRRKHNIYEVGDYIVKARRLKDDNLYQISNITDSLNWVKTSCGAFIDAPMFRHATDAEIKAGKRL